MIIKTFDEWLDKYPHKEKVANKDKGALLHAHVAFAKFKGFDLDMYLGCFPHEFFKEV